MQSVKRILPRARMVPLLSQNKRRLPCSPFSHLNSMTPMNHPAEYSLRIPPGPEPFPVQEPPDPPENPDMPVREPDPEDPGQI
jgi:hypothetical protein